MISIISGTNRRDSNTRKVAGMISTIYSSLDLPSELIDLCELPLEIASPDAYARKPAALERFSTTILKSDGLVIITPEYNGGLPGMPCRIRW
jgi:NAD(P)H-dependent FMN reductase